MKILKIYTLLVVLFSVGCGSVLSVDEDKTFHIQAHRGAGLAQPENTLECFTVSWNMDVTPEADLRVTKDGVIVCFHDKNFKRVVARADEEMKKLGVEDLVLADVQTLEVGSFRGEQFDGQRIPELSKVFVALKREPGRLLYLDIKEVGDLEKLALLIEEYGVAPQVIFTTSHHEMIRDWKKRMPESLTLLWNGGGEKKIKAKLQAVREADFEGITHLQIHVKVSDLDGTEPFSPSIEFLEQTRDELKSRGIVFQVLPWKCTDPEAYMRLLELGVESFATDYPEMTVEVVRKFKSNKENK